MKKFFYGVAVWNTAVAVINMFVLPLFVSPETMVYVTPVSQFLPIAIPVTLANMV